MRSGPARSGEGNLFPPRRQQDLVYRGGRTIPNLSYKSFYIGKAWVDGAQAAARQHLDSALAAAMSDPTLNEIVSQYFGGSTIMSTPLPSAVLDVPVQLVYDMGDIQALALKTFMSGALGAIDLDNCVINFVLPPGAVLSSDGGSEMQIPPARRRLPGTPENEDADSKHGLGGYHGSIHIQHPGRSITLYYAAAVWSEGDNGIAVDGWEPWENACATLYHELNEARTDPDVDDAIRTGDRRWVGWNSNSGDEIGDFPIDEAGSNLKLVFKKVEVATEPRIAPIQLLWSNRVHGPEAPGVHQAVPAQAAPVHVLALETAAAAAPPPLGTGIVLSAPGKLTDFTDDGAVSAWSAELSTFFDNAIEATRQYLKGLPSQFFNPARGVPNSTDTAELPIRWPGFPRLLENSNLSPTEQLRRAELISGTYLGRYQHQDEYLEWFVARDSVTKKIVRIDFTCEGPEYWEFLAEHEPATLLSLYQKHIDPAVKMSDLVVNSKYHALNVWNTRHGAMHLIQPNNSLSAEIRIAGDATILRKNPDGSLKAEAQDLINCARYGVAGRASDPHIGDLINGLARAGYLLSIKDPVGLYMSRPNLIGCTTPDGNAIDQAWFSVTRGSEDHILRGVFTAPPGSAFVAGDVSIAGVALAYGGQIAKLIQVGLTGVAYGKGSISNPAFPCVSAGTSAAIAGLSAHVGRGR
ncbi:hypothetical protein WK51_26365 [Burkholderia ubonensis]|nr:hypothetical protein WK51_26365 [Burkholderia ubonensis]